MPDEIVTRGEFELLRQMVTEQGARIGSIDDHGTRGVIALQTQIATLIADMAELKAEMKADRQLRVTGRRWVLTLAVTGTGAIAALVTALLEALARAHGG